MVGYTELGVTRTHTAPEGYCSDRGGRGRDTGLHGAGVASGRSSRWTLLRFFREQVKIGGTLHIVLLTPALQGGRGGRQTRRRRLPVGEVTWTQRSA